VTKAKLSKPAGADPDDELERLRHRMTLFEATEQVAQIGHFEWNYDLDRLESCSEGYAQLFGVSIAQMLATHTSREKSLAQVHPQDLERYLADSERLREANSLDLNYRLLVGVDQVRHVREIGIMVGGDGNTAKIFFGILQDVTKQVNHERDLEYRDELASQAEMITDIGHFIFDEINEVYVYISEGFARIYGTSVDAYTSNIRSINDDLSDIHVDDRARVSEQYRRYLDTGEIPPIEYRIHRADGEIRWIRELSKAHRKIEGRVSQTIGVQQDITERVQFEQELILKDTLATQAEAITDIGHFIFDEINNKYLFASPGLEQIYGIGPGELVNPVNSLVNNLKIVHEDDRERVQKVYDEFMIKGDPWQVDYRLLRGDGQFRWVRELGKAHLVNHGISEQTIGVLQDITDQKKAEQDIIDARDSLGQKIVERTRELANTVKQLQGEIEERKKIAAELEFLANHDALTGLPSLRLCKDRLDHSLAEARRNRQTSAVMFLDLDGFKAVNDSYGHELGDLVLKVTADRIKTEIRETDTVARIGGDEFVIILSSLPKIEIAQRIATSLIEQISQAILIGQNEVSVSASIGIAIYPEDGTTSEELIRTADKAMYLVKHSGKSNFGFARPAALN